MFLAFWAGLQQDIKLVLLAPAACALFRLAFILVYGPKKSPVGEWRKWFTCFRYGFWWGMDFNAYVYLYLLVFVSLPAAFIPAYYAVGDTVRLIGVTVYLVVLYTAFMGKMIFYYHFHDTFNPTMKLGVNADKMNFVDIFFNQNYGAWILLGYIPYTWLSWQVGSCLLRLPNLPYLSLSSPWLQYGLNTIVFLASILFFYWLRYGGTLRHRQKPEWDEVPPIVKNDMFMGKATVDDLIAFELACKSTVSEALLHTDAESLEVLRPVLSSPQMFSENLWAPFQHQTKGARIRKPKHIFFLLGESHGQAPFDAPYEYLNLMEASRRYRSQAHTVAIDNFLPAGMISQPALTSLLAGVYDAGMELNENKAFWYGNIPISLPLQLKKLGYRTEFWYGGGLNWGSLEHFVPAIGFDAWHGGPDFCPKGSPKTWLGVYDHIFLEQAAKLIQQEDTEQPVFHFLYTTSNHGPYNMPYAEYGFSAEKVMPAAPEALLKHGKMMKQMAGIWYADQALIKFVEKMQTVYPDSLFVVTGDHTTGLIPFQCGVVGRTEPNLRERVLTSFAISHPELTADMLAENTIGGHMNIMPTLFELIAPAGFTYYSIAEPLTEPIHRVVTPYCWLTHDRIGDYRDGLSQQLAVSEDLLPFERDRDMFREERDAWCELTGWLVRHPELLDDAGRGKMV